MDLVRCLQDIFTFGTQNKYIDNQYFPSQYIQEFNNTKEAAWENQRGILSFHHHQGECLSLAPWQIMT
jgi:hypothetical protein